MSPRFDSLLAAVVLAAASSGVASVQAEQPPLWGGLAPGPHPVGFHRLWELDGSRVWPRSAALDSLDGSVARPIRVDVWYPASSCPQRMPLETYLRMEAPATDFEDLTFLTRRWDEYSYSGLAEDSTAVERLLATETAACLDAPAASGRFPLVLYSAGWFNRAPDNSILAEYLASHGFVVATVPQLNPGLWTFDFRSDAPGVENQTRDLEVALGAVMTEAFVDRRRIAAMGYSTGGDVALLLQERNPLIDVVVGLDASWALGADNDVQGSGFFGPERTSVPVLALRRPTEGAPDADTILDSLTSAPRVVVEIPGADHGTFSDDPAQQLFLGMDTAEQESTHVAMARSVLDFLRSTLLTGAAFDGTKLAEQYRSRGLNAKFRPISKATPPTESGR